MNKQEKIKNTIGLSFEFAEQIISDPDLLNNIPDGAYVFFIDGEIKIKRGQDKQQKQKYVKVKRQFEVL